MVEGKKMFIDGEWVAAKNGNERKVFNPTDNSLLANVAEGSEEDVDNAISAAKRAFYQDGWKDTPASERVRLLEEIAAQVEENAEELAVLETMDSGKPIAESRISVQNVIATFKYHAGLINKPSGQTYNVSDNVQSMVVREPIGVCGLIVPWNLPIQLAAWKLAPALAAGNTVVFKPSEVTPLTAIKLFEIFEKVQFPKGVVNLVLGAGETVGKRISSSHDVEKISFTGGTETGRSVMREAAGNMKNISLELGGKSPNIVFVDADLETSIDHALYAIFFSQGQICSAGTRLLLQDEIHDDFVEELVKRAKKIVVGNGMDENSQMGPLVSEEHLQKVLNYIKIGQEEGATLACGGNRIVEGALTKGNFMEPTIFIDTKPDMRIIQEEIFGPVLVVQKFKDEEEAIKLANDTMYGLAGGVFTNDGSKAQRVIRNLRAGITWINSYHTPYIEAPWGGYKQSGIGRELGTFGYESYTEVKQINISLDVKPSNWF